MILKAARKVLHASHLTQAHTQTFKKGCEFQLCRKSYENSHFEAKIRGVNSVSGEKQHDFEIICPAIGVRLHPLHPLCVRSSENIKIMQPKL